MKNFTICHLKYNESKKYNYFIFIKGYEGIVNELKMISPLAMKEYFNINLYTQKSQKTFKEKYNFKMNEHAEVGITFSSHEDAQKFIDEILIPYEITININQS